MKTPDNLIRTLFPDILERERQLIRYAKDQNISLEKEIKLIPVAFARWLADKASSTKESDIWVDENLRERTTEQLFDLFISKM